MLVDGFARVFNHLLVDFVTSAFERFGKSSASHYGSKLHFYSGMSQLVEDKLLAELELVGYVFILAEFFCRVAYVAQKQRFFIVIDSDFCTY
jgi:hypothetical protein